MARYGKSAQTKVKKVMQERKRGTLKSGRSGKKVTSRKQAIAIGLSEARKAGARSRGGNLGSSKTNVNHLPVASWAGFAGRIAQACISPQFSWRFPC